MTQIQAIPAEQEIKPANPFVRVARPHGLSRWILGLADRLRHLWTEPDPGAGAGLAVNRYLDTHGVEWSDWEESS